MANLDIAVPRQGHYFQQWQLADADGLPIDLTGHTLEMDCRRIAGSGAVIASATLTVVEAISGQFNVVWDGADFAAIEGETQIVRLAYDLKHTFPDSIVEVPVRGQIILMPEVTS